MPSSPADVYFICSLSTSLGGARRGTILGSGSNYDSVFLQDKRLHTSCCIVRLSDCRVSTQMYPNWRDEVSGWRGKNLLAELNH